jgi:uracil-DNA glycosylase family 4
LARNRYDDAMPDDYGQLLDATIQHLEDLKSRGVRNVAVAPETLRALAQPAAAKSQISNPKSQMDKAAAPPPSLRSSRREEAPSSKSEIRNPKSETPINREHAAKAGVEMSLFTSAAADNLPASAPSPATRLSSPEKAAAFAALRERALACVKCPHLASSRKNVAFGVGSIDAQLMFVGEAPGADEDEQGEPFVGKAGQLLTKIVQATGLQRADVYIANILKCRPDTPGQSAGNRKPTTDEMATCIPYLHEQIDLIRPKVIVALGATAVEGLLGKTIGITKLRGGWKTYRGTPLMPTYHPAYLLRNQAMSEKRKVWEDMLAVMEKLEMPISDKQRNYFLKA